MFQEKLISIKHAQRTEYIRSKFGNCDMKTENQKNSQFNAVRSDMTSAERVRAGVDPEIAVAIDMGYTSGSRRKPKIVQEWPS